MKDPFDITVNSIPALYKQFPNEESCIKHLEDIFWRGNPISPFDKTSKVYKLKSGVYRCKNTGKNFTIKTGTMFEKTKIDMQRWFVAIWLVVNHKAGISSYQLAKDIGVTQKTAWFMLHKIRSQMYLLNENPLTGDVEIDETMIGGKNKNRHWNKKVPHSQGRSHKDKTPVVGMIQRDSIMNAVVTNNTTSETLLTYIKKHVQPNSKIYTDENASYNQAGETYQRYTVDHSKKLYSYDNITTNRIEAAWTHLKRLILGAYRNVHTKKYLQKYVDEFVFRYNLRDAEISDVFNGFLCISDGHITHKEIKEAKWIELTDKKQSLC